MKVVVSAALLALAGTSPVALAQQPASNPASMALPAAGRAPITAVSTVADLAAVCNPGWSDVPRLEAIAYCQGFVTAAAQYHALLYPAGGPARPLFCVPNPAPSVAQAGLGFAMWANQNPARSGEPALDGFLRWAQSAYPCPAAPTATPARATRVAR